MYTFTPAGDNEFVNVSDGVSIIKQLSINTLVDPDGNYVRFITDGALLFSVYWTTVNTGSTACTNAYDVAVYLDSLFDISESSGGGGGSSPNPIAVTISSPTTEYVLNHNRGYFSLLCVVDNNGSEYLVSREDNEDFTQTTIYFLVPFTGMIYMP